MNQIRVLLADDHELVRTGIKAALRGHPEFTVVAEAGDGAQAVREARRLEPELAVLDVRMAGQSGIEACREIREASPKTNVLLLTSYSDEKAVMAGILAGANAFMLKDVHVTELIEMMRVVGNGRISMDPASGTAVIEQLHRAAVLSDDDRLAEQLTDRELTILDYIADGLTNREIGERLFLSEKTVKHHVSDILGKLGLGRRIGAAVFAVRRAAEHEEVG